jgi:hypothetical protein
MINEYREMFASLSAWDGGVRITKISPYTEIRTVTGLCEFLGMERVGRFGWRDPYEDIRDPRPRVRDWGELWMCEVGLAARASRRHRGFGRSMLEAVQAAMKPYRPDSQQSHKSHARPLDAETGGLN